MIARTRSEVVSATPQRPLITFETVATDTPASAATSPIVTLRWLTTAGYYRVRKTLSITVDGPGAVCQTRAAMRHTATVGGGRPWSEPTCGGRSRGHEALDANRRRDGSRRVRGGPRREL